MEYDDDGASLRAAAGLIIPGAHPQPSTLQPDEPPPNDRQPPPEQPRPFGPPALTPAQLQIAEVFGENIASDTGVQIIPPEVVRHPPAPEPAYVHPPVSSEPDGPPTLPASTDTEDVYSHIRALDAAREENALLKQQMAELQRGHDRLLARQLEFEKAMDVQLSAFNVSAQSSTNSVDPSAAVSRSSDFRGFEPAPPSCQQPTNATRPTGTVKVDVATNSDTGCRTTLQHSDRLATRRDTAPVPQTNIWPATAPLVTTRAPPVAFADGRRTANQPPPAVARQTCAQQQWRAPPVDLADRPTPPPPLHHATYIPYAPHAPMPTYYAHAPYVNFAHSMPAPTSGLPPQPFATAATAAATSTGQGVLYTNTYMPNAFEPSAKPYPPNVAASHILTAPHHANMPVPPSQTLPAAAVAPPTTTRPLAAYYADTYALNASSRGPSPSGIAPTAYVDPSAWRSQPAGTTEALRGAGYRPSGTAPSAESVHAYPVVHRRVIDLPPFGGRPEDWPFFICSFEETTRHYGYTDLENMGRLQKALVGDAKTRVQGILIRPEHVGRTVETLARAFGRPDVLAESQLQKIRKMTKICEDRPEQLVSFSITVDGMVSLLDGPATNHLLSNSLLLKELTSKLPMSDQRVWAGVARHIGPNPTIQNFASWLSEVADDVANIGTLSLVDGTAARQRDPKPTPSGRERHVLLNVTSRPSERNAKLCTFCGEGHLVGKCASLLKLSPHERLTEIRKRPLCYNCLSKGHLLPGCDSSQYCGVDGCERRHHKLLHVPFCSAQQQPTTQPSADGCSNTLADNPTPAVSKPAKTSEPKSDASEPKPATAKSGTPSTVLNCQAARRKAYYRIVPVVLYGPRKQLQTYALLDEGSSVSMIDSDAAEFLQLKGESEPLDLQFVSGTTSSQPSKRVEFGISGVDSDAVRFEIDTVLTAKGLSLPVQTVDSDDIVRENPHLASVPFATFERVAPKLLLGLEHHYLGLPLETRMGPHLRGVAAARTNLGWVLYGSGGGTSTTKAVVLHARRPDTEDDNEAVKLLELHDLVRQHFTTEDFGVKMTSEPIQSDSDKRALGILAATTRRVGRHFETGLLWRSDDVVLPNNFDMALRRLGSVEAKMRRDPEYAKLYIREIQAYLDKGYARILSPEEAARRTSRTWHLPHFAVLNPNKPGKFRLVFDAAASVKGVSLNSALLAGPDLNVPLARLLFRFRIGAIGVTADIKEMFHQVAVRAEDQDSQRFLWRGGDSSKRPDTYVMAVMTFGSSCSPTSAQFVKNTNATEFVGRFPEAADAVKSNHYVDDFVASFRTTDDAQRITAEVIELQKMGGFELRGVVSNCPAVRQRFGTEQDGGQEVDLEPEDMSQKILGMVWDTKDDVFVFQTRFHRVHPAVMDGSRRPTKREVLSVAMSIFDPFGLLADFLLPTKTILQELWRRGVQWDESIPEQVDATWQEWRAQVEHTRRVRLARCYSPSLLCAEAHLELHVFADASEEAFAAVAYWRVVGPDGVELSLVAGKVRCAPLKLLSMPRLELQAAVLATRLMLEIKQSHESLVVEKTVLWTDSETVLKWLRCDQRRYLPFVAFRVAEVVENAPAVWWRWVPTALNVADDATRVKRPITFNPESRWLRGPAWLKEDEESWPKQQKRSDPDDEACEELRPKFAGVIMRRGRIEFERFSRFTRLIRAVAYVQRWFHNGRTRPVDRRRGELSADEVESGLKEVCRQVQAETYPDEMYALARGHPIPPRSKLLKLRPYLDGEGLIRLHGRTDNAPEEYMTSAAKRPIVMPPQHYATALLVQHHHELCAHQLADATMASVRTKFWIERLRTIVKAGKRACQMCQLRKAVPRPPFEGQLPVDRLQAYARPFTHTGLDFFGPYHVAVGRRREKRWVALFTCLVTRAVHLEVAADLSTDAVLLCLRNLCHLRGTPAVIRCDNGTNFVGARNELSREREFFDEDEVQRELSVKNVQWKMNCPLNPEAGGAWERLVQSIKRVLDVILHEEAPRVETFRSLLLEAANVVNSRPLTHLAVEPDDPEPITPNHFLIGGPNVATAPNPEDVEPKATRRQWQICRRLSRMFWAQFVRDYLPELTRRSRHFPDVEPLRVDDVVVVCDDAQPRRKWTRGIIVDVAVAADGAVRTATVRTASGELRRPATRLAKLDVCSSGRIDVRGAVSTTVAQI